MNSRWNRGGSGGQARGGVAAHPPRQNSRWGGTAVAGAGTAEVGEVRVSPR